MLELKNTMNDVKIVTKSNNTWAEEGICEHNIKSIVWTQQQKKQSLYGRIKVWCLFNGIEAKFSINIK